MIYTGITIGPVFDTIMNAVSPAALWFGSTMFSDITRRLCKDILAWTDADIHLISPAYDNADDDGLKDGVGKYHDRVIFTSTLPKEELDTRLKALIAKIKKDTVKIFETEKLKGNADSYMAFLEVYLQINYIFLPEDRVQGKNCILEISPYLDSIECMKTFPVNNENNPLMDIMKKQSDTSGSSYHIKTSPLYRGVSESNNQLMKNGKKEEGIWEMMDIASGMIISKEKEDTDKKYKYYFAVVNADADRMGAFLNNVKDNETITLFSQKCLEYSKNASSLIKKYGGMTIYAGGDDLLFLAPVKCGEKTIFDLCGEIGKCFTEIMQKEQRFTQQGIVLPTISFGISIQYYKFPLYEAWERSRTMLGKAKSWKDKNAIAVNLEKHSGQSAGLLIGNESLDIWTHIQNANRMNINSDADIINNFSKKIELNYPLLDTIEGNPSISHSWDNLFDNAGQAGSMDYVHEINRIYYDEIFSARIKSVDSDKKIEALLAILRISRFFTEKADERERTVI